MAGKVTYEDLEQRVKDLEEQLHDFKQDQERIHYLSSVVEQSFDGLVVADLDGNIIETNEAFAKMHGYSANELSGKNLTICYTSEQMPAVIEANKQLKERGEFHGEIWHVRCDGTVFPTLMHNSLFHGKTGNRISMIETCRDITSSKRAEETVQKAHVELEGKVLERTQELKLVNEGLRVEIDERIRAEHELTRTKALLDAVISQSPVPMVVITPDGIIEVFNEASRKILGFPSDEVAPAMKHPAMKKLWQTYDYNGNNIPIEQSPILRTLKNETTKRKEIRIVRKDGTERWLLIDAVPVYEQRGNIIAGFSVFQDITEFKETEAALREQEQEFHAIFNQTFQFIGLMTLDGILTEANSAALKFAGIKDSDVIGKPFWETPWWTHSLEMQNKLRDAVVHAAKGQFIRFEATHPASDGTLHVVDFSLKPVIDETGNVTFLIPEGRDITERKQVEDGLRKSEEEYRMLLDSLPDPVVIVREDLHILLVNSTYTKLFGYNQCDIENGLSPLDIVEGGEKKTALQRMERRFSGEKIAPETHFVEHRIKDGGTIPCDVKGNLIQYKGQPADLVILRNITERKEAEEALRESEQKYRLLAENVVDNIWVVDTDTLKITFCSPSVKRILGYTDKETMTQTLGHTLTSESMEVVMSILRDELSQEGKEGADPSRSRTLELEQIHKNGSKVWTETTATFLRDTNGNAKEILGVTRDISERKKAEESIRLFRNLVNQSNDAIFVVDPQTSRFLDVNNRACDSLRYEKKELLKLRVVDVEDVFLDDLAWEDVVKKVRKEKSMLLEGVHKQKVGTTFPVEVNVAIIEEEKRDYIVAVARDISARKQGEESLKKSEERLALALQATNDGIWDWDIINDKLYTSERLKKLIGHEKEDSMPPIEAWTSRMHPDHHDRIMHELREALDGNASYDSDYLLRNETGGYRWHNARGMVLFDKEGNANRMVGSLRDIHSRMEKEDHIRLLTQQLIKVQELERQRISRELHDHVAQDLAASKMICDVLLKRKKELTDDVWQKISKVFNTLGATLTVVRDLSYDLRPPDLEEWGLSRTISKCCGDFSQKTGLKIEFHPNGLDHLKLDLETGIQIFRLIQEGLNNTWKHAEASQATIRLVGASPNIILRIEDDGKGFDVKDRMVQAMEEKRMGLRNMEERASLLQGQMTIHSRTKIGTIISIKFPYEENRDDSKKDHINP